MRRRVSIPEGVPLAEVTEEAMRVTGRLASLDGVVGAAVAVDPRHWEVVHFSLWAHDSPKAAGEVYRVLHLSAPERDGLRRGRQW